MMPGGIQTPFRSLYASLWLPPGPGRGGVVVFTKNRLLRDHDMSSTRAKAIVACRRLHHAPFRHCAPAPNGELSYASSVRLANLHRAASLLGALCYVTSRRPPRRSGDSPTLLLCYRAPFAPESNDWQGKARQKKNCEGSWAQKILLPCYRESRAIPTIAVSSSSTSPQSHMHAADGRRAPMRFGWPSRNFASSNLASQAK